MSRRVLPIQDAVKEVRVESQAEASRLAMDNTRAYSESEPQQIIIEELAGYRLSLFSSPNCPFCHRVKALFESLGVEYHYIDVVEKKENEDLFYSVAKRLDYESLPMVLINGKFVGGCDMTCSKADTGELQRLLDLPSYNRKQSEEQRRPEPVSTGLFMFPQVANRWIVQATGIQVCGMSIVCVIYRKEPWLHWVCFGMALDFLVRTIAGSTPSVLGSISLFLTSGMQEELVAGPPKQFASIIGFVLYAIATMFFLIGEGDVAEIGGSVTCAIVAFASFLEGFFNFCAGCWVFGYLIKWKIVDKSIYAPYTDTYNTTIYTLNFVNERNGWRTLDGLQEKSIAAADPKLVGWKRGHEHAPVPVPVRVVAAPIRGEDRTNVDITYKFPKTRETWRDSWHIKHVQFADFGMALGIAGLANVFLSLYHTFHIQQEIYMFLGISAGAIYGILLLAMLYRVIMFPRKLIADISHPIRRNTASLMFMVGMLLANLVKDHNRDFMHVLWLWGAIGVMGIPFFSLMEWIRTRTTETLPVMIIPFGALFVGALIGPQLDPKYAEWGKWFFGMAFLFFIVLLVMTFQKGVMSVWSNEGHRSGIALWMGLISLICPAYMVTVGIQKFDLFCYIFFTTGIMLFVVNLYLVYPAQFLLQGRFGMHNWAYAFPIDVVALGCIRYYNHNNTQFAEGLVYVLVIFAVWANTTMFIHTLTALFTRKWPRPMMRFFPLHANRIEHEALRIMGRILVSDVRAHREKIQPATATYSRIREFWNEIDAITSHHDRAEDVLFEEQAAVNPQQVELILTMRQATQEKKRIVNEKFSTDDLSGLADAITAYVDSLEDDMQWEEDHLLHGITRKFLNPELQHAILERMWEACPLESWRKVVGAVVRYCPMEMQRTRYLRALFQTFPDRREVIGLWVYRSLGSDPVGEMKWAFLVRDVPEMESQYHRHKNAIDFDAAGTGL